MVAAAMNATIPFAATGEDTDILARTIFGEARNQTMDGQIAVAWTIRHRAEIAKAYVAAHKTPRPNFGDGTIANACLDAYEFSCWNTADATRLRMLTVARNEPGYQLAQHVALGVVLGLLEDRMPGTTHYFNPAAVSKTPDWVATATFVNTVGAHRFYRNVP
jgi:N-acetylmuramoyl-L-alanine amidase